MQATLFRHPAIGAPQVNLTVLYERRGQTLWVRFVVEGDVEALAWPMPTQGGRADRLWERTCFEVFVATADGYCEFNLSPSGQWAGYRFEGYRQGMAESVEVAQIAGLDSGVDRVALEASIDLSPSAVRLGLSAVIESKEGARSFWALTHPGDEPDFHHPGSFALNLTEPA